MPNYGDFVKRLFTGRIVLGEVYAECAAQIKLLQSRGIKLSHVDSHQHLHVLPGIINVFVSLMKSNGIYKMRMPAEPINFFGEYKAPLMRRIGRDVLTLFTSRARHKVLQNNIIMPEHFFGMLCGGHMDENNLLNILRHIADKVEGTSEIMLHPGNATPELVAKYPWKYSWSAEKEALTSPVVKKFIRVAKLVPCSYNEL